MKKKYIVGILSTAPMFMVFVNLLFPSIKEGTLIMACIYMTIAGLSSIYFLGDDALDIGTFSAILLLLIGVIEAYDYVDNRRGSLGEIAECSAMVLCSIGYFHHMLAHIKQTQKLKDMQYYKKRCEVLEKQIRDQDTNQ